MRYSTVSRDDAVYSAFPDVARTASGRLICAYREGDSHSAGVFSRVVTRSSDDDGETWSATMTLASHDDTGSGAGWDAWNCPRLRLLPDGRLLLVCDYVRRLRADGRELSAEAENYLWWSSDDGASWQGPRPSGVRGIVPDRITTTRRGTLLLLAHHEHPQTGVLAQYAARSEDGGNTWGEQIVVAHDGFHQLCEGSVVQLDDQAGTLVCYLRENSGRGWPGYKSFSTDDGATWHGPYPTTLIGCHRPTAGLLASGNLLITHCLSRGEGNRDPQAALETQRSAAQPVVTLQYSTVLALDHDNHARPDAGYNGWAQLPDGTIYCVYYLKGDSDTAWIRAVRFREEEIVRPLAQ